jgi:hypothetical protein
MSSPIPLSQAANWTRASWSPRPCRVRRPSRAPTATCTGRLSRRRGLVTTKPADARSFSRSRSSDQLAFRSTAHSVSPSQASSAANPSRSSSCETVAARMETVKRCKSWRVLSLARRPSGPPSPKYRGARDDEHPIQAPSMRLSAASARANRLGCARTRGLQSDHLAASIIVVHIYAPCACAGTVSASMCPALRGRESDPIRSR